MKPSVFKALADPIRQEILEILKKEGKKTAGDIASKFNLTGATISYHLKILKESELVTEEKYKNFIYYDMNFSVFEEIMLWFERLGGKSNEK